MTTRRLQVVTNRRRLGAYRVFQFHSNRVSRIYRVPSRIPEIPPFTIDTHFRTVRKQAVVRSLSPSFSLSLSSSPFLSSLLIYFFPAPLSLSVFNSILIFTREVSHAGRSVAATGAHGYLSRLYKRRRRNGYSERQSWTSSPRHIYCFHH